MASADWLKRENLAHVLAALTPENRLVMSICMATGLRVGDVLALRTGQLKQRMTIKEQKTGKTRRVYFPSGLYEQMTQGAGRWWVFEGRCRQDRHRTRSAVYKDIKRAARLFRSDIVPNGTNIGTHTARKVWAVERRKAAGFQSVKKDLNHSSDAVTMIYALADELTMRQRRRKRKPMD